MRAPAKKRARTVGSASERRAIVQKRVAFGLHDPGRAHDREVLGDVRLADPHLVRQAADFLRLIGEEVEDLEPAGAREYLHDLRLEAPDRVHAGIIYPCASAHKVPMARSRDRPAGGREPFGTG